MAQVVDWIGTERYEVVRLVVRGGMGRVYEAYDRERRQRVALKTLLYYNPTALFLFKQEFRTLADTRHPNLVRLYELVATEERVFFSMEFVDGVDFLTYVREAPAGAMDEAPPRSPADIDRLRSALGQLVEGVEALHAAGKLHRDIKPSNVLVTPEARVVMLDFGIALDLPDAVDRSLHEQDRFVGTAGYMAPEQVAEHVPTLASDWYSVGVLLYEALVGRPPFEGPMTDVMQAKTRMDPVPPSGRVAGVPADLDELCRALLDRDPTRRPTGPQIARRLSGTMRATRRSPPPATPHPVDREASLVGRAPQGLALREAFDAARAGRPVTVHVRGSAGMGKSSVVRAFLDGLVERAEAVVLRGRAYERESVPYKAVDAVIDTLSRHLMHLTDTERNLALPPNMDALARLFPVLRRVPSVGRLQEDAMADPQRIRARGFEALRELLSALASRQPLVVAIDDAHWGDTDSAALLLELVRPPHAPALLLIFAYREDSQAAPFLDELRRRWPAAAELRTVSVEPLLVREARELALALLGSSDAAAQETADAVARESGGNPFLLEELVRASPLRTPDAADRPITLDEVVGARLAELSQTARDVVEMIAVCGRPLPVSTLAEAAGVDTVDGVVASLIAHRFVRSGLRDGREVVEPEHDRIRETIVGRLTEVAIRKHHARLALTLERMPDSDPEALAMHLIGAGEIERAAEHAEHAAERAASKLAFDQAVRLQRMALESAPAMPPDRKRRLRGRLGELLEWAGFGAEAARVYLDAAEGSAPLQRAEFERAAAEQFLTCGRIDDGADVLHRALATAGLRTPASPLRAVLWLLLYRAWVAVFGLRFTVRTADELDRLDRLRLDALFAAALGFAIVDVPLGACIQARYLMMALRSGEPLHVLRAALLVSTQYANAGGPQRAPERALRELVRRLVDESDSGEMQAFFQGTRGVAVFLRGRWAEALEVLDTAYREYPNNRAGWHSNANLFAAYCLLYMGRTSELAARHERLSREAEQRGDLYTTVNLQLSAQRLLSLAADDPETARRDARAAMLSWSQRRYLLQHWQATRTEAEVDVYVGQAERAYTTMRRDARALAKSFLLHGQFVRILTTELRGRCAIASAEADPAVRPARLTEAGRLARKLEREGMPYATLFAAIVRAGTAGVRRDEPVATEWLHVAIRVAEQEQMILHGAASRCALGALVGGDRGRDLTRRGHEAMEAQGVRAPARLAALLVPGFGRRS